MHVGAVLDNRCDLRPMTDADQQKSSEAFCEPQRLLGTYRRRCCVFYCELCVMHGAYSTIYNKLTWVVNIYPVITGAGGGWVGAGD